MNSMNSMNPLSSMTMQVQNSSFVDWQLSPFKSLDSREHFNMNIHPMTGAMFFDLNSLIIDDILVGGKLADHLFEHGFSQEVSDLLNSIYKANPTDDDEVKPRVPLRLLLSSPVSRIVSPYFNNPVWWHIAFDKSLGGRLLFVCTGKFYKQLSRFIRLLREDVYYYNHQALASLF